MIFFAQNRDKFDIVFIDGLHQCQQAEKDIDNSLKCLNTNGVVVLHDCMPKEECHQFHDFQQGKWTGDVWKAFWRYRQISMYEMYTVNTDWGYGVIDTAHISGIRAIDQRQSDYDQMTWEQFAKNHIDMMNIISPQDFMRKF